MPTQKTRAIRRKKREERATLRLLKGGNPTKQPKNKGKTRGQRFAEREKRKATRMVQPIIISEDTAQRNRILQQVRENPAQGFTPEFREWTGLRAS